MLVLAGGGNMPGCSWMKRFVSLLLEQMNNGDDEFKTKFIAEIDEINCSTHTKLYNCNCKTTILHFFNFFKSQTYSKKILFVSIKIEMALRKL